MKLKNSYTLLYIIGVMALVSCSGSGATTETEHDDDHGHGHGESAEVEITQAQMDAVGITLGEMERRSMSASLTASGLLEVGAGHEGVAASMLPGTIRRICVAPGQKVSQGAVVAYVEAPELISLQTDWSEATRAVEAAELELKRQEALAAQGAGVRRNLDAARSELSGATIRLRSATARLQALGVTPGASTTQYAVKAPVGGTVVAVEATIGSFADIQMPIARIVDTGAVYCTLQVNEKDITAVREGMEVDLRLTNNPGVTLTGKVAEVTPLLDEATRSIPVRVTLTGERPSDLIPGMAVNGRICGEGETVDALPEEAVVSAGGKHYIFVLEDEHEEEGGKAFHFEKVEVMKGATAMGYTAITPLEPIDEVARIVVTGAFYLNSMTTEHGEHSH